MRGSQRRLRRRRRERAAEVLRHRLAAKPVIAVTGSAAKTTTVKLLAHLLGGAPRVGVSMYAKTAQDVLGEFCSFGPATEAVVLEASEFPVGTLQQIASLIGPTAAVVTIAGLDHYTVFCGAGGAAREMATRLRALPAEGFAVLNADDGEVASLVDLVCLRHAQAV